MKPTPTGPDPSTPSPDAVEDRAEELTAEEKRAGVDDPEALAEAVLSESEDRTFNRTGTAREHRSRPRGWCTRGLGPGAVTA